MSDDLDALLTEGDGPDPMSDREWRVFCEAAQRAHRSRT